MPIWLRNFTIQQIIDFKREEKKQLDNANKKSNSTSANIGDPVPEHIKSKFKQAERKVNYITKKAKK